MYSWSMYFSTRSTPKDVQLEDVILEDILVKEVFWKMYFCRMFFPGCTPGRFTFD